ncbi:MAG: hypothetical protein HC805_07480 [Alkalinema sp. RL_2_19]|nr:hypothetical protein [Alkalinema sp. RL_2_19]
MEPKNAPWFCCDRGRDGVAKLVEAGVHPLVVAGHELAIFGGNHGQSDEAIGVLVAVGAKHLFEWRSMRLSIAVGI